MVAPLARLAIQIVVLKWFLVGAYRPGWHQLHGLFHFQHWAFGNYLSVAFLALQYLFGSGTMLSVWFLRLLGASVGRGVHIDHLHHISGFDLLTIEDGATLNIRASLQGVRYSHRGLEVGPVYIGRGATVGARAAIHSRCKILEGAVVWDLSTLPSGSIVQPGTVWQGVLAKRCSADDPLVEFLSANFPDPLHHVQQCQRLSWWQEWRLTIISCLVNTTWTAFSAAMMLITICGPPFERQLAGEANYGHVLTAQCRLHEIEAMYLLKWSVPLVLSALIGSFLLWAVMMLAIPRLTPGVFPLKSTQYLHMFFRLLFFNRPWNPLYSSTTWSGIVFRVAGAKLSIDTRVTKPGWFIGLPEMIEFGDRVFTGDGALIGYPSVHAGSAYADKVILEPHSFVGNHGVIPCGTTLPTDTLVGVQSIAPRCRAGASIPAGNMWLGSPPVGVPNAYRSGSASHWHQPTWPVHLWKWVSDTCILLIIPFIVSFTGCGFFWFFQRAYKMASPVTEWQASDWDVRFMSANVVLIPFFGYIFSLFATSCTVYCVVALYYPMVCCCCPFRGEEKTSPYWSGHVIRWEFKTMVSKTFETMNYSWSGTEMYNYWQRLLGAQVGSGVVMTGVLGVLDPEFAVLGDHCVLEFEAAVRSHTHEGHRLNMGRVRLGNHCTLGLGSSAMQLTRIADHTEVAAESCVTKGQIIRSFADYAGCPAQPVRKYAPGNSLANGDGGAHSRQPTISAAERRADLVACAGEAAAKNGTKQLQDLFERTVQVAAQHCAVETCDGKRVTYTELDSMAWALAFSIRRLLSDRGIDPSADLDEGLLSLFLPHSCLYVK
jgi:non-ribosomal peptide synthetase-like protein